MSSPSSPVLFHLASVVSFTDREEHRLPTMVADFSGNGRLNAFDVSLVAQFSASLPVSQIPPIPSSVVITNGGGGGTPPLSASTLAPARILASRRGVNKGVNPNDGAEMLGVARPVDPYPAEQLTTICHRAVDTLMADSDGRAAGEMDDEQHPLL